jgi:hypothetical protein
MLHTVGCLILLLRHNCSYPDLDTVLSSRSMRICHAVIIKDPRNGFYSVILYYYYISRLHSYAHICFPGFKLGMCNIYAFENIFYCHCPIIHNTSAVNWIFCVLQVLYKNVTAINISDITKTWKAI